MRTYLIAQLILIASCNGIDWTPVTNAIGNFSDISDMTLVVANASGIIFTYDKGSTTFDSYLNVASSSKWIASLMINRLVENGTMNYSDRPQKYIPWWTSSPDDARSNVTLSFLLSFISGFETAECNGNSSYTMESCVMQIYNTTFLYGPPGTQFAYGGDHLAIAALMSLYATGYTNWNTLFNDMLKVPLNLSSNSLFIPTTNPQPAGGLTLRVSDYYKILYAIYMVTYVSNDTKNIMEQDHTSNVTFAYSPLELMNQVWHYGYGLWVECHYKEWQENCTEFLQFSSPGKNGFYPWIDRKNEYFAIIGTFNPNYPYSTSTTLGQIIQPLILTALGVGNSTSTSGSTTTGSSSTTTSDATSSSGSSTSTSGSTTTTSTSSGSSTSGSNKNGTTSLTAVNIALAILFVSFL